LPEILITHTLMLDRTRKYRVFVSVAEHSADAHCAGLITTLCKMGYDNIEFVGVGGPKMAQAGCKLLQPTIGQAVMLYNALIYLGHYYRLINRVSHYLKSTNVDLVIVCDSPSYNFHIAKAAKKAGLKTLFYIAPQLWAWGGWRIRKLRKYCDKLCCILPFEKDWFGCRGMDSVFVGNPLFGEMDVASSRAKTYAGFESRNLKLALMPGSRAAEIESLWRPMQQIALRLKQKYPAASFVTVAVDAEREQILRAAQIPGFQCRYDIGTVSDTARACDFAIVASGSATLEVAAAGCPMVIMYQSSRLLWHLIGRWMVKTEYLSLVNILSGRELVPEFMPYFTSIEPIVDTIERLLDDKNKLAQISGELIGLIGPLAEKKAGEEVAKIVVEMLT